MARLENKVAVITGGNSGIGLATAHLFKKEGASVVINARNEQRLAETKAEVGDDFEVLQLDVSKTSELEQFYKQVGEQHGKIDVLFLNAGIGIFQPVDAWDEATFDHLVNVNVKGVFFGVQKALPYLAEGASVIINTSISNQMGMPASSVYAASKAAVRSLARTLSAELLPRGIRVNAVSPGPIATPIYDKMGMPQEQLDEFANGIKQQVPLGRFGSPEEVAHTILFFASPESSYVVGTELEVDGGMTNL
ncbi:MAG: SDR family oxidoreductase [Flammeovirgaceae bacterium]